MVGTIRWSRQRVSHQPVELVTELLQATMCTCSVEGVKANLGLRRLANPVSTLVAHLSLVVHTIAAQHST